jgi:isopentenyldiphosphate isomerase
MTSEEWFDILSHTGEIVSRAPRHRVHGNPDLLHAVVHLHIFSSEAALYLQKRAGTKDLYPDKWDTAVGGHVLSGEDIKTALHREVREELGIELKHYLPLFNYIMRNSYESEWIYAFAVQYDGPFFINTSEISEGRFWTFREIEQHIGKNMFTPNFESEFTKIKGHFQKHPNFFFDLTDLNN